ncbi:glycosyltransferase [Phytoactinopolyspora halotolerans]|uniref:Glycosyltransferase family 1 protein n=1 Tax=Phytoactinopolyspora halotolerans TaxID=1981512 RepID=A0A6L9SIM5_9ACTN|nr:glycosyltransferase [Phytoactinopolyspora halotolerans]NEE03920.1 glycosyltransferase family 1 protein [Phytoactinopolyspora halotolerans]
MKVLILSFGSRGDTQPFVALARAFQSAGHKAVLAVSGSSASLAEPYGIPCEHLGDTFSDYMKDPRVREALETNYGGLRGKKLMIQLMRAHRREMEQARDRMAELDTDGADVLIHQSTVPGNQLAERAGIPSIPVFLVPDTVPTSAFPNPLSLYRVPRPLYRASYAWSRPYLWGFMGGTRRWRTRKLGLPYRRHQADVLRQPDGSPSTVLHAFSRHMLPAELDYPDWVHTTGYWFLPRPADWQPPRQLTAFLDAGEPPVYVGFGSMAGLNPRRTGEIVAEAIRLAGARAVVVTGWGGIELDSPGTDVLVLQQAPFDWLFPRMAAIVHHGGSGTIGSALASGRPQVVCPFQEATRFLASRMCASGVAPAVIPQVDLSPRRLAVAMRRAVKDPVHGQRAAELGRLVRAEGGAPAAVKIVESVI